MIDTDLHCSTSLHWPITLPIALCVSCEAFSLFLSSVIITGEGLHVFFLFHLLAQNIGTQLYHLPFLAGSFISLSKRAI